MRYIFADAMNQSPFSDCGPALIEAAERLPTVRDAFAAYSDRRRQTLVDAIAAAADAGEVHRTIDPEMAAMAIAGAVIYRRVMGGPRFDPRHSRRLVDAVLGPPPH